MMEMAKKHKMVIIVPIYEEEMPGVYYNTAAVIDADGTYLGKVERIIFLRLLAFGRNHLQTWKHKLPSFQN